MDVITRTTCRVCQSAQLMNLFSLGTQYVSDFVDPGKEHDGIKCPIDLVMCNTCSLVQLRHTAPQDLLYKGTYWYRSGVTQTMRDSLKEIADEASSIVNLKPGDIVLDIGSNDGTLLRSYSFPGIIKVGVEPAKNMVEEGSRGVNILVNDFWSADSYFKAYETYQGSKPIDPRAKVITALGMMYDLEDPQAFISDIAKVLHTDGVFIAQLMCLKNMVDVEDIGNLAHEHLEFYPVKTLNRMYNNAGMYIYDIKTNNINGQSYRIYARKQRCTMENQTNEEYKRVNKAWEDDYRIMEPTFYRNWYNRLEVAKAKVVSYIRAVNKHHHSVAVYGASTKGNVILQYYGLDNTLIRYAADRSPSKWGKVTIGTGIPIVSEDEARRSGSNYFLVLPYAFLPEFIKREKEWLDNGGVFIVPLPTPKLVYALDGQIREEYL